MAVGYLEAGDTDVHLWTHVGVGSGQKVAVGRVVAVEKRSHRQEVVNGGVAATCTDG